MQTNKGRGCGFALMSSEKKREIASKGGKPRTLRAQPTHGRAKRLGLPDLRGAR